MVSVDRNTLLCLTAKKNFSRWSQFLRYHLKAKTYDRDKKQTGKSPGKKPDRQAEPGSQHETDRVTVLRNQEASWGSRAACQRIRPAGCRFGRGDAPAEQAGCGHYPQAGGRSQQHQPAGAPANAGGFALVAVELVKLKNRIVEIINRLSDDWKNKKGKRI